MQLDCTGRVPICRSLREGNCGLCFVGLPDYVDGNALLPQACKPRKVPATNAAAVPLHNWFIDGFDAVDRLSSLG
jgi:hypothetical protein